MNNATLIRSVLSQRKKFVMPLRGRSMEPTLYEGDMITLVPAEEISVGDVILFEIDQQLILHRVTELFNDWIVTKGDNHDFCDDMIKRSQVLGKQRVESDKVISPRSAKSEPSYIAFNSHGHIVDRRLLDVFSGASIQILNDDCTISDKALNVCVIAMANQTLHEVFPVISKHKNTTYHFNTKVSNKERDGYYVMSDFDYLVRLCGRISHSFLSIDEQMLMVMGILNNNGGHDDE